MLKNYIRALGSIFFPPLCFYCTKKITKGYLCPACTANIESAKIELLPPGAYYDRLICAVHYKEPVITLVHKFKYNHCDYLADFFSKILLEKLAHHAIDAEIVTCVPSHPAKIKERGYNPPAILAEKIANSLKIPFIDDIIYQRTWHQSQTKMAKDKRATNVENTFAVKNGCKDKKILMIDDVYTTGATINNCCRILKENGALKITAVTLAKSL